MFVREDTLRVKVAEGHVQYLREILEWTEFTKRVFDSLDLSVNEVETTILDRGLTKVNFEHSLMLGGERARMMQDGGGVLGSWLRSLLSAEGSLLLLFNPMAEKKDQAISLKPYTDVFYYHDRVLDVDKVVHVLMYAGFVFACLWGYRKPLKENGMAYRRKALWITLLIGIIYGILTEIMQEFLVPGRTGSVYDWIADVIGCIFGVIIAYFLLRDRNNLKNEALHK